MLQLHILVWAGSRGGKVDHILLLPIVEAKYLSIGGETIRGRNSVAYSLTFANMVSKITTISHVQVKLPQKVAVLYAVFCRTQFVTPFPSHLP
jgi:hypothetical protein